MNANFNIPSTIILGGGTSDQLVAQVQRLGARRALLVTDAFLQKNGLAERFAGQLRAAGVETGIFAGVQPDPTAQNVMDGLGELKRCRAEVVIGLGGGSPMDAAKVCAILATNPPPIAQYAGYHKVAQPGLPLVVIPTTAGTGSEVTKVAVITDTERDVKMMLLDGHLLPRVALVDYELTMTMPPALTAHVGVDTLTHAIEAYVSRRANPLTDPIALSCTRLVAEHLLTAFREPDNRPARGDDDGCVSGRDGVQQQQRLPGPRHEPAHRCSFPRAARAVERRPVAGRDAVFPAGRTGPLRRHRSGHGHCLGEGQRRESGARPGPLPGRVEPKFAYRPLARCRSGRSDGVRCQAGGHGRRRPGIRQPAKQPARTCAGGNRGAVSGGVVSVQWSVVSGQWSVVSCGGESGLVQNRVTIVAASFPTCRLWTRQVENLPPQSCYPENSRY